jgi:hypothetical protein
VNDDQDLRLRAGANAQRLAKSLREDEAELVRFPQYRMALEVVAHAARAAEEVKELLERTNE